MTLATTASSPPAAPTGATPVLSVRDLRISFPPRPAPSRRCAA